MRISDIVDAIERIAPPELAEDWDNVGLLVGDPETTCKGPVLLTIDLSQEVVAEAAAAGANAVVAYHPPIFKPIATLTTGTAQGRALLDAVNAGIAVYSPHTAIDAAAGGVTDWLADAILPEGAGSGDRRALVPAVVDAAAGLHKLVVMTPVSHAQALRDGLASVGAGRVGNYEQCSFEIKGHGTFWPTEGANPAAGTPHQLNRVEEVRLEMVCPAGMLPLATEVIRGFHPYEEPAWEAYPLAPRQDRSVGAGRRLTLDQPATAEEISLRLKTGLGVDAVKIAAPHGEPVRVVGVCPGAGESLMRTAAAQGCELFVTGEVRYHAARDVLARGCGVLLAGHTNTERGYLPRLSERLAAAINAGNGGAQKVVVSRADVSPFRTL